MYVIAASPDVEKAFDNVWYDGLRHKIYQLDLPTKFCRWFSDFLVGESYRSKLKVFCLQKSTQKQVPHKVPT